MKSDMADKPLVSIVLPTYNRAHVLPRSIQSVLRQSFDNLELIIVDDNSSDGTKSIVDSFSDSRIRYIKNDPNLKLPRTLNRGFEVARGQYLAWTSDDNLYSETAIGRMVEALQEGKGDFIFADYFDFYELDENGLPLDARHVKLPDQPDMKKGNQIGACFMYRREVYENIGMYDPGLFLNEDYDYWMRISREYKMYHIPEPLYYFKRNEESLYCANFCEVRAGSLLVRYKNNFMGKVDVLEGVLDQITNNIDRLNNGILRGGYLMTSRLSYRLKLRYQTFVRQYFRFKLKGEVFGVLVNFDRDKENYQDVKQSLAELMRRVAIIEYRR